MLRKLNTKDLTFNKEKKSTPWLSKPKRAKKGVERFNAFKNI